MTVTTMRGSSGQVPSRVSGLDRFFEISARGSTVGTEVRGGLATFATMAYIIVLNPIILTAVADVNGDRLDFVQVAVMTCLVAAISTFFMGVVARHPFAIAAGLGINSYVAVQVASQVSWPAAMGLVVVEGVLVFAAVMFGVREAVMNVIPASIRISIGVGIGAFLLYIAFVDSGLSRRLPDAANTTVPVGLGVGGRPVGWPVVVFVFTVAIMLVMLAQRRKAALLTGIVVGTLFAMVVQGIADLSPMFGPDGYNPRGWALSVPEWPSNFFDWPDFGLFGEVSPFGAFSAIGFLEAALIVFTLYITDFFDTIGSLLAVGKQGDLLNERGELSRTKEALAVDAGAAVLGGMASASSNTTYIESAAGVGEGARTGLASVVTAVLFAVAMFATPMAQIVPMEVAAAALVAVAIMMIRHAIMEIDWRDFPTAAAAVVTIFGMPFTYSIANGIGFGLITYSVLKLCTGKGREVHVLMRVASAMFLIYFCMEPVEQLLGIK